MNTTIRILLFLIVLSSCRKDPIDNSNNQIPHDTIKPLPYFPAYPGSYWKYLTIKKHYIPDEVRNVYVVTTVDSIIVTDSTSSEYVLHSYPIRSYQEGKLQAVNSDSTFVPFFNGKPIYQYSKLYTDPQSFQWDCYLKYKFFSEQVSDTFATTPNYSHLTYTGLCLKVIDKYTTNGVDSIVSIRGSYYGNSHFYETEKYLYKKNVGLIYYATYSPILKDTFYIKKLIDFKIWNK